MLVGNAAISQYDGHSAGARLYGRAPRLPMGSYETSDSLLIMNTEIAPGRHVQKHMDVLAKIRLIYHETLFGSKLKLISARKSRNMQQETLFIEQSVYYWKPPTGTQAGRWAGPKIIEGVYDAQVLLIETPAKLLTIAWGWVRPVNETLKLLWSDGQLRISPNGGQMPLNPVADTRTLAFLQKYADLQKNKNKRNIHPLKYSDVFTPSRPLGGELPVLRRCTTVTSETLEEPGRGVGQPTKNEARVRNRRLITLANKEPQKDTDLTHEEDYEIERTG